MGSFLLSRLSAVNGKDLLNSLLWTRTTSSYTNRCTKPIKSSRLRCFRFNASDSGDFSGWLSLKSMPACQS